VVDSSISLSNGVKRRIPMKNNKTTEFGKLIEQLRRTKKLTQDELAFRCKIGRKSMSSIETGRHLPSIQNFIEIALNLDMDPSDLFIEIEKRGIIDEILGR
jgi:DNA-binding XRE family transcriptional regulator